MSRQLLHEMEELNRKSEKERELGHLFLNYEEKLTQVYREYCSYYSVRVLPLLNKVSIETWIERNVTVQKRVPRHALNEALNLNSK